LASGAKSNCVHIWKVDNSQRVSIYRRLQILQDITGVSSISWSQDSQFLTVSTPEENNTGVFVFDVRKGTLEREFKFYGQDTFSVASFFKDQSHKFAAGDQKGHFSYYVSRKLGVLKKNYSFPFFF
jgi:WD40 repeat protein